MTQHKSWRRGATATVAAISAIAIAAPGATAAASAPDVFAATGEALALELSIVAPEGVLNGVTGSSSIVQKVSFTDAELNSDGVANAAASLLDGTLATVGINSASGESSARSAEFESSEFPGLSIGAGTTEYVVDAAGNHVRSFSELAHINASLAPLLAELPAELTEPLQGAVQDVTDTVNGLVDELNGGLTELEGIVEDTVGTVIEIPQVAPTQLPQVPDVTTVDLVEIRKMWSESLLEPVDGKIRSTVHAGIVEASLLGGLIEVPTFQYTSWAEAGGVPGSANAGTDVTTIAVRVAGSDVVSVNGDRVSVGDVTIDLSDLNVTGTEADEALNTIVDTLTSVLNSVGLSVAQGEGTTTVAPDGTSASAATSAFSLKLSPLHAAGQGDSLSVGLRLMPTKAAASAAIKPVQAAPPADEPPAMPRTGGGAAFMVLGTLAMGGAGLLRRMF